MPSTTASALALVALLGCAACIDTSGLLFDRDGGGGTTASGGGDGGDGGAGAASAAGGAGGSGGSGGSGGTLPGYPGLVIEDGAIAYWPLDVVQNGTRTPDLSGNGEDAYIDNDMGSGAVDFEAEGVVGQAATLQTGASLFVDAPHPLGFGDSSYTLEAWVAVQTGDASGLWTCRPEPNGDGYSTFLGATSVTHKRYANTNIEELSHQPIVLDMFRHVAITFDAAAGEGQLYVDGEPVFLPARALSESWVAAGCAFYLAGAGASDTVLVDEVAVYDRALTQEELARHYACGATGTCD